MGAGSRVTNVKNVDTGCQKTDTARENKKAREEERSCIYIFLL
jgi:hypothetical protein